MANNNASKIFVNYSTETVRFEYECSFDKFTTRNEAFVTKEFAPPGRREPLFYLSVNTNAENIPNLHEFIATLILKSSTAVKCKTSSWLLTKSGDIWKSQGM